MNGKYTGSTHRDCNTNAKLNHKFLVVFHSLRKYDSHLIMQELGNFNLKINVTKWIRKIYELKYQSKLSFIDSFHHVLKVWNKFEMKTMKEYYHLYSNL